jgi:hypothetical protein
MVNGWQAVGIAIVVLGLLAFLLLNERATRLRRPVQPGDAAAASEGAGPTVT